MKPVRKIVAVLLALFLTLLTGCKSTPAAASATEASQFREAPKTVQTTRKTREGIQTMLVMGLTDSDGEGSYRSGYQSDLLLLIVMDQEKKSAAMLQINPDTLVPFTVPGTSEETQMPLGMVISYGSGGSDSCLSQRKAVSKLLLGVPIDHYMTLDPASIAAVSDMLGGICVTLTEPFRQSHSDLEESTSLQGDLAKEFFFSREAEDVSNEDHMERQRRFLTGLFTPFMASAQDDDFLMQLTMQLGEGFTTDLTLSQMVTLLQDLGGYQLEETILTLPGETALVDGTPQFQPDVQELEKVTNQLFF